MTSLSKIQQDTAAQMQQFSGVQQDQKADQKDQKAGDAAKEGSKELAGKGKDAATAGMEQQVFKNAVGQIFEAAEDEVKGANEQSDQLQAGFAAQLEAGAKAIGDRAVAELLGNKQGDKQSARDATSNANNDASLVS